MPGPIRMRPSAAAAYRRWPYWNKNSYYFITNTELGEASSIKFRLYYDQFRNGFDFYDDATYSTMKKSSSSHSLYDDHSDGASSEFTTRIISRNVISASFFFKDDTHKEINIYPGRSPYPFTTPTLLDRAQLFSIGFQDAITLSSRLRATVGFSADHLKGLQAQTFNSTQTSLLPVTCISEPNNTSFAGCTAHVWNYNPQASVSYALTSLDYSLCYLCRPGPFPGAQGKLLLQTGCGHSQSGPEARAEQELEHRLFACFCARTVAQVEYFRSDLRDAIQSVYIKDPGSFCTNTGALAGYCSQNVNIAKEVHEGFEISIRSSPLSRLTLDVNYSYINRSLAYDFGNCPDVSQINTAIQILPTMPKNKLIVNAILRLPHRCWPWPISDTKAASPFRTRPIRSVPATAVWSVLWHAGSRNRCSDLERRNRAGRREEPLRPGLLLHGRISRSRPELVSLTCATGSRHDRTRSHPTLVQRARTSMHYSFLQEPEGR